MRKLLVSLLSIDNEEKQEKLIREVKDKKVAIHFDITDEKFVLPKGVELEKVKISNKCNLYSDVHLMVERPVEDKFIDNAILYGADSITIHYEIENFESELKYLIDRKNELKKQGKNILIGVAIKVETDVDVLDKYIDLIDKVLIMSVNVGYGGQPYDIRADKKITYLREKYKDLIIEIDGGINDNILKNDVMKNVNEFVIGSAITKYEDYISRIDYFLESL